MIINYNKEQLQHIVNDIYILTGINISVLDTSFDEIAITNQPQAYCSFLQTTDSGYNHCLECDKHILQKCSATKTPQTHICSAGLYDFAMPVIKNGVTVAFVIMGQVRSENSPASPTFTPEADIETIKTLDELYQKTPFVSKDNLNALYDLLPRIIFDSSINIVYDSVTNEAVKYIDENLTEPLCIKTICEKLHISKNRLYQAFETNMGCTVNVYITEKRISLAQKLLLETDYPVYTIGEMSGIDNYTYFCKLFKKHCGVTPNEFRKSKKV